MKGTKDTIQCNQAMALVGGGDAVGGKRNNQIEATTAVVGTVGAAIDGGAARAKGKMSGWQMMQGNWVAEDATVGGGRQRKVFGRRRTQQEGEADNARGTPPRPPTMHGNWAAGDTTHGAGPTPRTQCSCS
jgi:hypothetical protein